MKKAVSYRLSDDAIAIAKVLAKDTGLSEASVLELALRDLAKARGIEFPKAPKSEPKSE